MPKLTLLMIITPPDFGIAKYSLRALRKHIRALTDCSLVIYQNGLSELQEHEVRTLSRGTGWSYISNRMILDNPSGIKIGECYKTDLGAVVFREGLYENCEEIWSRELVRLESPLVGTVDADFEIFDPSFITEMLVGFEADSKLAIFATDHSETKEKVETYSQTQALVMERWHTWFCIYRKAALAQGHDFSYKELRDEASGLPRKYDSAAWVQKFLLENGWRARASERSHEWKYIHYGAFAKNTTLTGVRLASYRFFRILRHNGFRHLHRSEFASKQLRRVGSRVYQRLGLGAHDRRRERYIFGQDLHRKYS